MALNPNGASVPTYDPAAGWEQVSREKHHLHLATTDNPWFPASGPAVTVQPTSATRA